MTAMMNYYRAALRHRPPATQQRVTVPTHIVWGTDDRFLGRELAEDSARYCENARVTYLATTHWVQHEAPTDVSDAIIAAGHASR
jgi:pimeloyl-ACP methyl ester carboxylesterase